MKRLICSLSLALTLLLIVSLIPASVFLASAEDMPLLEDAVWVDSIKLNIGAVDAGTYGDIYSDDDLYLIFDFHLIDTQVSAVKQEMSDGNGASYMVQVPIPAGLRYLDSGSVPVRVSITDIYGDVIDTQAFATLQPMADGSGVFMTFEGEFWSTAYVEIEAAQIVVACRLDMEDIGDDDNYPIMFGSNTVANIAVGNNQDKSDHTLVKNGTYDPETKKINWEVTYTPGASRVAQPITFVDTFDSEFQSFVNDSLEVDGSAVSGYTIDYNNNQGIITYAYTGALTPGTDIVFTYQTQVSEDAYNSTNYFLDTALNNKAQMCSDGVPYKAIPCTVTITSDDKSESWLTKRVTNGDTSNLVSGDTIDWEVTVRCYDLGFTYLYLNDTIPDGLELVEDSVKVKTTSGTVTVTPSIMNVDDTSYDATAAGSTYFVIDLSDGSGGFYSYYTITYQTKVTDDAMKDSITATGIVNPKFDNKAWLTFAWPSGIGTPPKNPEVELIGVGVDAHIIQKSGVYNKATHTITWTVTVNPYGYDVINGVITEKLNWYGGNYYNGGMSVGSTKPNDIGVGNAKIPDQIYDESQGCLFNGDPDSTGNIYFTLDPTSTAEELIINVSSLGTNKGTFTFTTVATNEDFYAYNHDMYYRNTVDFIGTVLYNGDNVTVTDTAQARARAVSTVLQKTNTSYNYDTNIIEWKITVNSNGMQMDGAVVLDTIPRYQAVESVEVSSYSGDAPTWVWSSTDGGAAFIGNTGLTAARNGDTYLTVTLGDIAETVTITVKTKVLVNDDPRFTSSTSITADNSVVLKRTAPLHDTGSVTAEQPISNVVIYKDHEFNPAVNNQTISYTVDINPNGMNLTNIKMIDTLPSGLSLDVDSVKLWEANVSSDGTITSTGGLVPGWNNWQLQYSSRTFTLTLPEAKAYVLTYDCIITGPPENGSEFTNSISFEGNKFSSGIRSSSTGVVLYSGWALSNASGSASVSIIKKDGKTGTDMPLEGVVFELWTKVNNANVLYSEGETDEFGKLTFYPLNLNRDYWLVETSGITGYTNVSTAVVLSGSGEQTNLSSYKINLQNSGVLAITITNDRNQYAFSFLKVNESGSGLSGAQFTLTDKDIGTVYTAYSGSGGEVTFASIPFGRYALEETTAPSGYYRNDEVFTVEIAADGSYVILDSNGDALDNSDIGKGEIVNIQMPYDPSGGQNSDNPSAWPPVPERTGSTLIQTDDGGYIEEDEDGTPIGKWTFDIKKWRWTFEPFSTDDGDDEDPIPGDGTNEDPVPGDVIDEDSIPDDGSNEDPVPDDVLDVDPIPDDGSNEDPIPGDVLRNDSAALPQTGILNLNPIVTLLVLLGLGLILLGLLLNRASAKKKNSVL